MNWLNSGIFNEVISDINSYFLIDQKIYKKIKIFRPATQSASEFSYKENFKVIECTRFSKLHIEMNAPSKSMNGNRNTFHIRKRFYPKNVKYSIH